MRNDFFPDPAKSSGSGSTTLGREHPPIDFLSFQINYLRYRVPYVSLFYNLEILKKTD